MARTPIFAEGDIYKSCLGDWEKLVQDATGKSDFALTRPAGVTLPQCFWLTVESPVYAEPEVSTMPPKGSGQGSGEGSGATHWSRRADDVRNFNIS